MKIAGKGRNKVIKWRRDGLTWRFDIFVQMNVRLQDSQVRVCHSFQRQSCLLLEHNLSHKLIPAGHVQDWGVHVIDTEGVVSLDGSTRNRDIRIWIVGSKARLAIKQVEFQRLDPRGK